MKILASLFLLSLSTRAGAACVDWRAMGRFADVEAASVVFEGVVKKVDPGDVATCAHRIVFAADRVWKGAPAGRYVLLARFVD